MKKLSIAVVLMAAGVTFVNAQSKETKKKAKTETTKVAELRADTSVSASSNEVAKAQPQTVEVMPSEAAEVKVAPPADARRDPAVEQQKAAIKKEEARKMETTK